MAKAALIPAEEPNRSNQIVTHATTTYDRARTFLGDVRNEMRKVVTPSRKEVQATTTVVLVTVFVFAFYFWVVDSVFGYGLQQLMSKLAGPQ